MVATLPQPRAVRVLLCLASLALLGALAPQRSEAQVGSVLSSPLGRAVSPAVLEPESGGFLERQLAHPRVQRAYERKADRVEAVLDAGGVERVAEVFFRVFKRERELEVWAREPGVATFTRVKTYPVCDVSGELGPKRRQGDLQIPEGFYTIDIFNPSSRYHLSMRVDYPNAVDRARNPGAALGGDIYIHGGCATIGCVPVTDDYIEELYLVAAVARDAGQPRIPVHIFPTRLEDEGVRWLDATYGADHAEHPFWLNLREGYLAFESTRVVPRVGFSGGRYTFAEPRSRVPLGTPIERLAPSRPPVATLFDAPLSVLRGLAAPNAGAAAVRPPAVGPAAVRPAAVHPPL